MAAATQAASAVGARKFCSVAISACKERNIRPHRSQPCHVSAGSKHGRVTATMHRLCQAQAQAQHKLCCCSPPAPNLRCWCTAVRECYITLTVAGPCTAVLQACAATKVSFPDLTTGLEEAAERGRRRRSSKPGKVSVWTAQGWVSVFATLRFVCCQHGTLCSPSYGWTWVLLYTLGMKA